MSETVNFNSCGDTCVGVLTMPENAGGDGAVGHNGRRVVLHEGDRDAPLRHVVS